jgi:hypothetical protein
MVPTKAATAPRRPKIDLATAVSTPSPDERQTLLLGYGISVNGLPASWPHPVTGPTRAWLEWAVAEETVPAFEGWSYADRTDGLTVRFGDEAEYLVDMHGDEGRVRVLLGPASEWEAALSFTLAVLPLSLPLFDLEPFHGSAVRLPEGRALLVLGSAEAGKSTTAAELRARGLGFLADDACAIDADGMLWPGPSLLASRAPNESPTFGRYDGKGVASIEGHGGEPVEVAAALVLRPQAGSRLALTPLSVREGLIAVLSQVRSPWILRERRRALQFLAASHLGRGAVATIAFDKGIHAPGDVAAAITEWAQARS